METREKPNASPKIEVKLTRDEYFRVSENHDVSFCYFIQQQTLIFL